MSFASSRIDFASLPSPGERFDLLEVIGEGTYGEVYVACDMENGEISQIFQRNPLPTNFSVFFM